MAAGLTDPVPVTVISGIISFVIGIIFLSLIGTSSAAMNMKMELPMKIKSDIARSACHEKETWFKKNDEYKSATESPTQVKANHTLRRNAAVYPFETLYNW